MGWVSCLLALMLLSASVLGTETVKINDGLLAGSLDATTAIHSFKGIPFAAPPVGELRWQPPQAVQPWSGARDATQFASRSMQNPIYSDMKFRSAKVSEDSLYLNVWTPAVVTKQKLPVLLYFYGGGFIAGSADERRYDGASMAQQDIVVVTANYRLGVFGLFAHPQLSAQTDYHGSGNYSLLDQQAALQWVVDNIQAFGGDPKRITIGGESAGSISVSALLASPLSKGLIGGAIGQSGSIVGPPVATLSLADGEKQGQKLQVALMGDNSAQSFAALRHMPAEELLAKATAAGFSYFSPNIDGYFLPVSPLTIYQKGQQADVPLLVGDNSQEGRYQQILEGQEPTLDNYQGALKRLYPQHHAQVAALYPAKSSAEVMAAAQALASDRFMGFATWNWIDLASAHNKQPSYYYFYDHIRPVSTEQQEVAGQSQPAPLGAVHSAEIEYALGNLQVNPLYKWQADDHLVSSLMQHYFANFIKQGDPNGQGLVNWPRFSQGKRLVIDSSPRVQEMAPLHARYLFHRQYYKAQEQ
ncbi:MAG: para-nitrobenzyl esterase [Paraglaciecola sp.]|jgi:para-nitrobenzyl esterase